MHKKQINKLIFWGILFIIVLGFTYFYIQDSNKPGKYTTFAQCLDEREAQMYGAFWCPHCESQLAMFGKAKDDVPYTECSNPDRSAIQICITENIGSYPTWKFAEGGVKTGVLELEELSALTGCELPI